MRLSAGDTPLPGYRLDSFLGRGVYGERWKATGPGGTEVALKFIALTGDQGIRQARSLQRLAQLHHAHVMPIQAVWLLDAEGRVVEDAGDAAVPIAPVKSVVTATPLADQSLAQRLEEYRQAGANGIPAGELLQHMEDVARAIDMLARKRIDLGGQSDATLPLVNHGGIKPQNILLLADSAVVSDHGLSTALGSRCSTIVSSGAVAYLAPECMLGAAAHPASDQYALAVCYAELRSGRVPMAEETSFAGALNQQQEGRLDLSDLPDAERGILARATAANVEERFGSCLEMVRALQQVVEGFDVVKRPISPPVPVMSMAGGPAMSVAGEEVVSQDVVELPEAAEGNGSIWVPLFVAASIGFAVYAGAQLASLRSHVSQNEEDINDIIETASDTEEQASLGDKELRPRTITPDDSLISILPVPGATSTDEETASPVAKADAESPRASEPNEAEKIRRQALRVPVEEHAPVELPTAASADTEAQDPKPVVENPVEEPATSRPVTEIPADKEPGDLLRREDIPADQLERAGDGDAAKAPSAIVAIFGESDPIDLAQVMNAAQSRDGRLLAASNKNHHVRVWNVADRSVAYDLAGHDGAVYSIAFSPDSRVLVTGGTTDHEVRMWRVADGSLLHVLSGHSGWVTSVAFSSNGETLATGGTDGNVMLWDAESGRLVRMIDGPEGKTIHALAFSPDGASIAIGGVDHRVSIREVATGLRVRELAGHEGAIRSVAFSADGSRLATAGEDHKVKLWDLSDTEAEPTTLDHHERWVRCVTFSADSKRLASCGYDGKVHVCDATTGDLVETIEVHPAGDQLVRVMFSESGRFLTTVNGDGTVYILRLEAE